MRVLLCDDHLLFLEALGAVIRGRGHDVVMQFDRDLVFASCLNWMIQHNFMPIDFIPELVLEASDDVLGRN